MPMTLGLALVLALLGARTAMPAERSGEGAVIRELESSPEIQALLSRRASTAPVEGVAPGQEHDVMRRVMAQMRQTADRLLPVVERLDTLRPGYSAMADLSVIDTERARLGTILNEGVIEFKGQFEVFGALREKREADKFQQFYAGALKGEIGGHVRDIVDVAHFGDEMWSFQDKLYYAIQEDAKAYDRRRKEIERARARSLAQRRAAAGAGALLAVVASAWAWTRRRPRKAGAVAVGKTVGGCYRLDRELGRGSIGLVFEAFDLSLQRRVAVKQVHAELRRDVEGLGRLLSDARRAAGLKHPHIVEVFAIVSEGLESLLVLEFAEGETLGAALRRMGPLSPESARELMGQAGSALDFAHAHGILHGDLKPANIMLLPEGTAKLMDLGLAYAANLAAPAASWGMSPYMSPELENGAPSRESDLYSLGVILYEAVTGALPFPGPNLPAQKREMRFAPPSRLAPDLPPAFDDVVRRALQADPKLRFHSATEFLQALGRLDP